MSVRLNKVGHILEAAPVAEPQSNIFQNAPSAIVRRETRIWPFVASNLVGEKFRAYRNPVIGSSGSTVNYCGQGGWTFRASHPDYFLAGFDLSTLFDQERDTPSLIGLSSQCEVVTSSSQKLPQIIPMILWGSRSTSKLIDVNGYCILTPTSVSRFTAGVSRSHFTVDKILEVSANCLGAVNDVYMGWWLGRSTPSGDAEALSIKTCDISVSATSLKGNRPVFDPVLV